MNEKVNYIAYWTPVRIGYYNPVYQLINGNYYLSYVWYDYYVVYPLPV